MDPSSIILIDHDQKSHHVVGSVAVDTTTLAVVPPTTTAAAAVAVASSSSSSYKDIEMTCNKMTDLNAVSTNAPAAAIASAAVATVGAAAVLSEAMIAASTAVVATAVLSQVATTTPTTDDTSHQAKQENSTTATTATANTTTATSIQKQPLEDILHQYVVPVYKHATIAQMHESIEKLDQLLYHIEYECSNPHSGRAPGFETNTLLTTDLLTGRIWSPYYPYETLRNLGGGVVPLPSPASALKCYRDIRQAWVERLKFEEERQQRLSNQESLHKEQNFCSCIATWDHCKHRTLIHIDLANQVLEQNMVQESSKQVTTKMLLHKNNQTSPFSSWDEMYMDPETSCPSQDDMEYASQVPIRFLRDRDDYISIYCQMAFQCQTSIKVCTSYLFADDPAHRYILLDLLPHMAAVKGVQVDILVDLMTVESAIMKSALRPATNTNQTNTTAATKANNSKITNISFLEHLPPNTPGFDNAKNIPKSALAFLQQLVNTACTIPQDKFKVRWWCARDGETKYRIKNHAKCSVFDEQVAFIGGSNLVPTVKSATSDCDLLVQGHDIVRHIHDTFLFLWNGMDDEALSSMPRQEEQVATLEEEEEEKKTENFDTTSLNTAHKNKENEKDVVPPRLSNTTMIPEDYVWDDPDCRVSFVRSSPTSDGEDAILRAVLGAIHTAKVSITMCMGHCNIPASFTAALAQACERGVQVRLMVNSLYSNDLRGGQRDLFLSLHHLMTAAPKVQVYTTDLLRHKPCVEQQQPAFLHSKYVVVDHEWSAVGSWNLWTRAAFYEMEHELLIYSTKVASYLEGKFDKESNTMAIRLQSPDQCLPGNGFCPKGCYLCEGYGPFFVNPLPLSSSSLPVDESK